MNVNSSPSDEATSFKSEISNLKSQISDLRSPISNPSPSPAGTSVDLVALAMQHRAQAQQDQVKAAQAETHAKAYAVQVQKEAKELAEETRDFATAVRMIEELEPHRRDAKLYEKICRYRDRVVALNADIQAAVQQGQLRFLNKQVKELLKLQPNRDEMRRLLSALPNDPTFPELAAEFTNSVGMRFVLTRPGEFLMGSEEREDEKPVHNVVITPPVANGRSTGTVIGLVPCFSWRASIGFGVGFPFGISR